MQNGPGWLRRALEARRSASDEGPEPGFTLIELMVVLLILAILLAIAIPTFLGVTGSANDRAAQSNLNTTFQDAKGIYESHQQSYPALASMVSSLKSNEPSLTGLIETTANTALAPGKIGIYVSNDSNGFVAISLAKKTNNCWVIADNTSTITPAAAPSLDASVYGSPGIPVTAGDHYAMWNTLTSKVPCEIDQITAAVTTTQSSGFPSQASAASATPSQCPTGTVTYTGPGGPATGSGPWIYYGSSTVVTGVTFEVQANTGPSWSILSFANSTTTNASGTVSPGTCVGTRTS